MSHSNLEIKSNLTPFIMSIFDLKMPKHLPYITLTLETTEILRLGDVMSSIGGGAKQSCFQVPESYCRHFVSSANAEEAPSERNPLNNQPRLLTKQQDHPLSSERKGNLIVCPLSRTSKLLVRLNISENILFYCVGGRAKDNDSVTLTFRK